MQHCPNCGAGELEIIAVILERPVTEKILTHLGLDPQPPPKGRAHGSASHTLSRAGRQRDKPQAAELPRSPGAALRAVPLRHAQRPGQPRDPGRDCDL